MGILEIFLILLVIGLFVGAISFSSVLWWFLIIVLVILAVRVVNKDKNLL